jgi:hypothetical protein
MAGALACFAVMFLINPIAGVVAIALEIGLWLLIKRKERRADWGDARRDVYEALVRWALIKLKRQPVTARNWRPNVLVFSEDATRRVDLLRFGHWFGQGRGVITSCEMVVGDLLDDDVRPRERRMELDAALDREGVIAFSEVNVVRSIEQGIIDIAQANGMAGFQSNLVMVGWRRDPAKLAEFLRVMKRLERLNKSVLIGRTQITSWLREGQRRNIHIWWGGLQRNGDMMLLLAHLLTRNPEWRGGRVTVNSIASTELMKRETEAALGKLLPKIRINADVKVLLKPKDKSIRDLINEESYQADLVFLGLASPEEGEEETYAQRLIDMADNLPSFFLVKNASLFVGELVGYEHTPQQGVAALSDKTTGP